MSSLMNSLKLVINHLCIFKNKTHWQSSYKKKILENLAHLPPTNYFKSLDNIYLASTFSFLF